VLEKRGQYDLARKLQRFETHFVSKNRNEAQLAWMENERKNFLQREIYLKEELSALSKLQKMKRNGSRGDRRSLMSDIGFICELIIKGF
jgi:hypothetical protein